jgi:hypothetical protein
VPLVRQSGVDQQRAKRLEPENTAMLMHRGRSCASQYKLVADWQASKEEDAVKCLSVGAVEYEYQTPSDAVITHTTPRWGNTASGRRLDSPATPRENESNEANVCL